MLGAWLAAALVLAPASADPSPSRYYGTSDAARVAGIPVGDLSNRNERAAFDERRSSCRMPITVRDEYVASQQRRGTLIEQRPPSGGLVRCGGTVTLVYSGGPQRAPEPSPVYETPPVATPPVYDWLMPGLASEDDETRLDRDHRRRCDGRPLNITRDRRYDARADGALVSQQPRRGASIACGVEVSVVRSQGQAPPPSFTVGRLDTPARRSAFEDQAGRYCRTPYRLTITERPDSAASGSYLNQTVPPETEFACTMNVGVTLASALPAWRMPDMRRAGAEASLARDAAGRCGAALPIERVPVRRTPQLLAQEPQAGDEIGCDTSIRLTYSERAAVPALPPAPAPAVTPPVRQTPTPDSIAGPPVAQPAAPTPAPAPAPAPAPPPAAPPEIPPTPPSAAQPTSPPATPLEMHQFVGFGRAAIDQWISEATAICGVRPRVTIAEAVSKQPDGTVVWQSATAHQRIACAAPVSFIIAREERSFPWWAAAIAALVAAAGLVAWRLWPTPLPRIVIGTPSAGGLPPAEGVAGALPITTLEALPGTATVAVPALTVESVEVENG